MLKRIYCEKFANDIKSITFHYGLNAVLGDSNCSNSIGKSTMLMIVDFCFGGDDYIDKEKNTIQHVGPHTIYFEYVFNEKSYYYSRSSDEPNEVKQYEDGSFNSIINYLTIQGFRNILLKNYNLIDTSLTFRGAVGRFFRIYNRNTHNETRPLNSVAREDDKSGIEFLMKLYNKYGNLDNLSRIQEEISSKTKVYSNLKRFNVGSIAENQKEYQENVKEIAELEKELNTLKHENNEGLTDADIVNAELKKDLKNQRKKLRNQRRLLMNKLKDLNFDKEYDEEKFTREFNKLKEFFPNLDTSKIEEYEAFHRGVKKVLNIEKKEDNQATRELISMIDDQIIGLDLKLKNYKSIPDVQESVLNRHAEIVARMKQLKEANRNYEEWTSSASKLKDIDTKLQTTVESITSQLQIDINEKIKDINLQISPDNYPPFLNINSLKSYSFYTPEDTGTGTRFLGVIIFDLAILQTTNIPVLVHDSIMFNNIAISSLIKTLQQYESQNKKQVFIAFDHYNTKGQELLPVLERNKILLLSDEPDCLFGHQWNKITK